MNEARAELKRKEMQNHVDNAFNFIATRDDKRKTFKLDRASEMHAARYELHRARSSLLLAIHALETVMHDLEIDFEC